MSENNTATKVRTVEDYLFGCVNFAVPEETVCQIIEDRKLVCNMQVSLLDKKEKSLIKADLYKWIILGAGKVNDVKDTDNGWTHAGGGYTLSEFDKKLFMDEANAIYEEFEPESVFGKKKIRMRSAGIMPAYRDTDGEPLPRRPI